MQFRLFRSLQPLVQLWLLPVVLPAAVIGLPNIASAQGDAINPRTEALPIYEQAVQLQQAGRYPEALEQFGRALTLFQQMGEEQAEK